MKLLIALSKTLLILIFFFSFLTLIHLISSLKVIPCEISDCKGDKLNELMGGDISERNHCAIFNPIADGIDCTINPPILKRDNGYYLIGYAMFLFVLHFYITRKILPRLYEKITKKKF
ncbi:hypothetical protein C0583_05590 [Candidatus Parcubacteria bacterium]|nr:MAG: hypothetical protein C0583_05590 [Candidatus Parcubacteria bacterium]